MTPRAKFIKEASKNPKKLAAWAWDAMMLASSHDPDHSKDLAALHKESILDFNRIIDLQVRVAKLELKLRNR
jgi:hypothetical protein